MGTIIPRYQPNAPLPGVPYWPGVNQKDSDFHILPRQSPGPWNKDHSYLHGVDLFNHGCYWEAHEAWEDLWLPLENEDPLRIFTQGLIQASAALLKIRLQQPRPANSIWGRGKSRLVLIDSQQEDTHYRGIHIQKFCHVIDQIIENENPQFPSPLIRLEELD
ncbi:MAG: DUF309 domain-containing protein [Planctomycetota bacterium]